MLVNAIGIAGEFDIINFLKMMSSQMQLQHNDLIKWESRVTKKLYEKVITKWVTRDVQWLSHMLGM